jgi:hypothetical protein
MSCRLCYETLVVAQFAQANLEDSPATETGEDQQFNIGIVGQVLAASENGHASRAGSPALVYEDADSTSIRRLVSHYVDTPSSSTHSRHL